MQFVADYGTLSDNLLELLATVSAVLQPSSNQISNNSRLRGQYGYRHVTHMCIVRHHCSITTKCILSFGCCSIHV